MYFRFFRLFSFLICFFFVSSWALLKIPYFESLVKEKIKEHVEQQSGLTINIDKIHGVFPLWINLEGIKVTESDSTKQYFYAKKIHLTLSPLNFFRKKIHLIQLQIEQGTLYLDEDEEEKKTPSFTSKDLFFLSKKINLKATWVTFKHIKIYKETKPLFKGDIYGSFSINKYSLKADLSLSSKFSDLPIYSKKRKIFSLKALITKETSVLNLALKVPNEQAQNSFNLFQTKVHCSLSTDTLLHLVQNKEAEKNVPGSFAVSFQDKLHQYTRTEGNFLISPNQFLQLTLTKIEQENDLLDYSPCTIKLHFDKQYSTFRFDLFMEWLQKDSVVIEGTTGSLICTKKYDRYEGNLSFRTALSSTSSKRSVPCTANIDWNVSHDGISIKNSTLIADAAKMTIDVDFYRKKELILGLIQLEEFQIESIAEPFGLTEKGTVALDMLFREGRSKGEETSQEIIGALTLQNFSNDQYSIKECINTFNCTNAFSKSANYSMKSTLQNACIYDHPVEKATLSVAGHPFTDKKSTFSLKAFGKRGSFAYGINAKGNGKQEDELFLLEMNPVCLRLNNVVVRNQEPIDCKISKNYFEIKPSLFLGSQQEKVAMSLKSDKKNLSGSLEIHKIPGFYQNGMYTLQGNLFIDAQLSGTKESPLFSLNCGCKELILTGKKITDPVKMDLHTHIDYKDAFLYSVGSLKSPTLNMDSSWDLKLPVTVHFKKYPWLLLRENDPITGIYSGNLSAKNPFFCTFLEEGETLQATATFETSIENTFNDPKINGSVLIEKGSLDMFEIGTLLENISFKMNFENNSINFNDIEGTDEESGKFTGSGTGMLHEKLSFDFDFSLDTMHIINRDFIDVFASGPLKFSGDTDKAKLSGTLTVADAKIRLTSNLGGDLPEIPITRIGGIPLTERKKTFLLEFLIDVKIPKNALTTGFGFEAWWKGKGTLLGNSKRPLLRGTAEVIQGTLLFVGKEFHVTQGEIGWQDDPIRFGKLNVITTSSLSNNTVKLILRGPLDHLQFSLQSIPPMPDKEILSWIIFNKSSSEITPLEGLQLAQVMLRQQKFGEDFEIFDTLKKTFGIDKIDIGKTSLISPQKHKSPQVLSSSDLPNEYEPNDNVAFKVGKYISDDVAITLSKDISTQANRLGIEVDLTQNISVAANIGDDADTEVFLKWKKDY